MKAIVVGTDEYDIAGALTDAGHTAVSVDVGNRDALVEHGIEDADVFVLTELAQATAISVAKECNPELKVVVYADGSLPDFARRQADIALDPALFDPDAVATELAES